MDKVLTLIITPVLYGAAFALLWNYGLTNAVPGIVKISFIEGFMIYMLFNLNIIVTEILLFLSPSEEEK